MKIVDPIEVDATELYRALSHGETNMLVSMVHRRMMTTWIHEPELQIVDRQITKSVWLLLPPHFISLEVDVIVVQDPFFVKHKAEAYENYFHGPIKFYNNINEWSMAFFLESIRNYPTYRAQ